MLFRSRSAPFPQTFESPFLNGIAEAFQRRRKAISYQGVLEWETRPGDEFEWLTVAFESLFNIELVVGFLEGSVANVFIRSRRRTEFDKVLLRLEGLRLPANGEAIVKTFEDTMISLHAHRRGEEDALANAELHWRDLALSVAG